MLVKLVIKLKFFILDTMWKHSSSYNIPIYPPSFYATHTQEEIAEAEAKEYERLQKMIDSL